jgi:SAM-dependent MidA family methyltransferase
MGIGTRGETLLASASAGQAKTIASGITRLTDPTQMGELFKVLAITPANVTPYPFS